MNQFQLELLIFFLIIIIIYNNNFNNNSRVTHLNHDPFDYAIIVNKKNRMSLKGTVRIFAAPRFDECGREFLLEDQLEYLIVLDTFSIESMKVPINNLKLNSVKYGSIFLPFTVKSGYIIQ